DLLQLRLSIAPDDFQYEAVLPYEIARGSVDRHERRQFHSKAILDVGGAQLALLDCHLAVGRRRNQPYRRQRPGGAVLTDSCKNSRVDIGVWLAFDLPLLDGALLLGEGEGGQRKQQAERGQCLPFHRISPRIIFLPKVRMDCACCWRFRSAE